MRVQNKSLIGWILLLLMAVVTIWLVQRQKSIKTKHETAFVTQTEKEVLPSEGETTLFERAAIPQKVFTVLRYVRANNKAPKGYVGGREFKNREKKLAIRTKAGRKIFYREWDVNPKKAGVNRGAERLVTGDDNRSWYTNNHYKSFKEVIDKP